MPWKDLAVSEQRKAFVDECLAQKRSKFELCAAYGISRPTGDKWLARFKERGKPGLQDQSRAPHRRPNAMDSKTEKQLLEGKERYPKWGARKIREALLLQDRTLQLPSPMAIHQLFARRGLVQERQQRRARPAHLHQTSASK